MCRASGRDHKGEHLRIWQNGAFNCILCSDSDPTANRAIRQFLYEGITPEELVVLETSIVDPEPKIEADKVYPESMLSKLLPNHTYWMQRGISEDVLRKLEGGFVPDLPRNMLSGRYVLPVRCVTTKRIVGWIGRLVSDASFGPKYKNLVKSKRVIYPLVANEGAIRRARKVVLTEGPSDCMMLMSNGIDYTLCLLGLNLNSRLLGFLTAANLEQIVISTNSDVGKVAPNGTMTYPGQEAATKLRAKLVPFLGAQRVKIRLPTTAKDWGETVEKNTGEIAVFKAELENPSS